MISGAVIAAYRRRGSTLVELLVSLALLGIIASVATLAYRRLTPPDPSDPMTVIGDTIETVLRTGTPLTVQFIVNGRPAIATINPDGSVVADSALGIDRLSGRRLGGR